MAKFTLSRTEIFFIINFVMLGVVMYWTSIVIQPTFDILEGQQETTAKIIDNAENNTALLVELFDRQNKLLANQIMLVSKVANATQVLHQSSENINEHVNTIIGQSRTIGDMIAYFRENFGERFIVNETAIDRSRIDQVLRNVTEFEEQIVLLREELGDLTELLTNRTNTAINFILPAAMATEDVVGDILASENISRNPPEINSTEVATGQISGFGEGPTVITPPS